MSTVLLILHLFVTLALIGVVLLQRSEGGGLGIGSSQGMGAFMTGRGTANLLTRTTAILAAAFMALNTFLFCLLVAFIFWVATMGDKGKAAGYGTEKGKLPHGVPAMAGGSPPRES